jgi:hypothetical protein
MKEHVLDLGHILKNSTALQACLSACLSTLSCVSNVYVCSLERVIMPNIMCRVLKYKVEFNSKF